MPTIREQSDQLKAAAAEQLPAEVIEVFDRSIEEFLAQGVPAGAVKVGDRLAPFTLDDASGMPVSLGLLVADGPAVVVFYRGGWCPYCNLALRTYQRELLPQLDAFGARLVAISPQSPDQSLSTVEKAELAFTVLSDPGSRVARTLGIAFQQADEVLAAQRQLGLDLAQVNAEGATLLPRPTVLIVDQDQIVRFIDVQPDYTARTEVAEILAALAAVSGLSRGQQAKRAAIGIGHDYRAALAGIDAGRPEGDQAVGLCSLIAVGRRGYLEMQSAGPDQRRHPLTVPGDLRTAQRGADRGLEAAIPDQRPAQRLAPERPDLA